MPNIKPANFDAYPLSNPNISQDQSIKGTAGYIAVAIVAGALTPVIGAITAPIQAIKGIWHASHLQLIKNQNVILNKQLSKAQSEKNELSGRINSFPFCSESQEKIKQAEETIKSLMLKLNANQEKNVDLTYLIQTNKQQFIASIFSLVPFLGIFAAGVYLKSVSVDIKESGIRGGAEALGQMIGNGLNPVVRFMLYPLTQTPLRQFLNSEISNQIRKSYQAMNTEFIKIPVSRGDKISELSAALVPYRKDKNFDPSFPVMVMFHGNGQTMDVMSNYAKYYQNKGYNCVTVTMGGYPGSDEQTSTSEISTYQDAHAIIEFLKEKGCKNISVHGISIGGTLAFAAAELHPDVVKTVIADQTLGRARDVAANLMRNISGGMLPAALVRGLVGGAFASGQIVPGVKHLDGTPYYTDGLNNIRKAQVLKERDEKAIAKCAVYAIKSTDDIIMGRNRIKSYDYEKPIYPSREDYRNHLMSLDNPMLPTTVRMRVHIHIEKNKKFADITNEDIQEYLDQESLKFDTYTQTKTSPDQYIENFADDIITARYGNLKSDHLYKVFGSHCYWDHRTMSEVLKNLVSP